MRRALLACTALLLGCGAASAQVVVQTPTADVYIAPRAYAPPPSAYEVHTYRSAPRVYDYRRVYEVDDDDDDVVVIQRGRRACDSPYRWDGSRCIYIRY